MVISNITNTVNYSEKKVLEKNDIGMETNMYEYTLYDTTFIITLGKLNDCYINSGVYFHPIYLLNNNKFISKIGVLEIDVNSIKKIYDEDGDIDLEKCQKPLFFSFVTKEYLNTYSTNGEKEENKDDEQTYNIEDDWINIYMGNDNYSIIDNDGGGDCLFYAVEYAFETINQEKTVAMMRKMISSKATDNVYENYKVLYTSFINSIRENNDKMIEIKNINDEMKEQIKVARSIREKRDIINKGKEITEKFNEYKNQNDNSTAILMEYSFMSDVNSLEDFKKVVTDKDFWADSWAITTLEREMNIKIVILSKENFENDDIDNVLLCGQDNNIEKEETFTPEYYIIVDYDGCHYRLISYNDMMIFDYETLPIEIKELIKVKCLERMGGTYSLINEFNTINKNTNQYNNVLNDTIYDKEEGTEFMIYSKSASKPKPGCGTGEKIIPNQMVNYKDLIKIKNWRRILSTHYESPVKIDNMMWNTVEHYFQGAKFKKNDYDYYRSFSMDSNSEYNQDPILAKKEVQKKIKLCDEDFDPIKTLEEAYEQLVKTDVTFSKVLKMTKTSRLKLYLHKKPAIDMIWLMRIRNKIM